ncbi:MAG: HD-GYP domain-containing protein [bacterium]|nr:HD-GYP domain-containing protein [bacterium]
MRKIKRPGLVNLIVSFSALILAMITFFTMVLVKNNSRSTFKGIINDEENKSSFAVKLALPKDKIWEEAPNQWKQQFDFSIDVSSKTSLKDWELTVTFSKENFKIKDIPDVWNIDKDKMVVEAQRIEIYPMLNEGLKIETITSGESNKFGFMIVMTRNISEDDFNTISYELVGRNYRAPQSYAFFWILLFLSFVWVAFFIAYLVFRTKEKNFEKFKDHTYNLISQAMNTFGSLIDVKDPYTKDHSARVSYYSVKIARKLGLDDDFVRNIAYIALMHDCGKLLIDDDILGKPDKLTDEEYNIMKTHTTNGGRALQNFTAIEGIKDGAMYHHERYDGNGYPSGLKGEDIPLCARIICVADALDAMSSDRCYRDRLTKEEILKELKECSGGQFDPKIASVVNEMIENNEIDLFDNELRKD